MNILNVGYDSTNYYLMEIKEGMLLVDNGWPGTLPKFLSVLKRKDVSPDKIKYLLVTHFHPDHSGLTQELKNMGAGLILLESQLSFTNPRESPTFQLRLKGTSNSNLRRAASSLQSLV